MLKAFRRSLSSSNILEASSRGKAAPEAFEEEAGNWRYLVVDANGIKPREETSYKGGAKCGKRVQEGEVVEVDRRRRSGWTKWLLLASGEGWIFDISPKDNKVRAVEVEVIDGDWQYQVLEEQAAVTRRPSTSQDALFGSTRIHKGLVVKVRQRIRVLNAKGSYLRLEDGGYVLDFYRGKQVMARVPAAGAEGAAELWREEDAAVPLGEAQPSYPAHLEGASPKSAGAGGFVGGSPTNSQRPSLISEFRGAQRTSERSSLSSSDGRPSVSLQRSFSAGSLVSTTCSTMSPTGAAARNNLLAVDLGAPEHGEWNYIVLDPGGVTLRKTPTYDTRSKGTDRVKKGEVVKVVERRLGNGTHFLRLESPQQGWAYDVQPGNLTRGQRMRMAEVDVERGSWYYRICVPYGIALRKRLDFDEGAKKGYGPSEGALVIATERIKVGATYFLKIEADVGSAESARRETGWIFDQRDGRPMTEGPIEVTSMEDGTEGVIRCEGGIHLRRGPTLQKWAETSFLLLQGAKVQVKLIAGDGKADSFLDVEGQQWVKIVKLGGMEGWIPRSSVEVHQKSGWATTAPRGGYNADLVRQALHAPNPLTA